VGEYVLRISMAEMQKTLNFVLDSFRKAQVTSFEITEDYYWNIPAPKLYDVTAAPTEPEMDIG
jgi:hypothetical protein